MEKILMDLISKNSKFISQGKVADYIPALSQANPNCIGIAILDANGKVYCKGDYKKKFTIQSISKIITLALALGDKGDDYVFSRLGAEGSEEPFNTMFKLDLLGNKPPNPMVNAGAIMTTSFIEGDRFERIIESIKIIIGRKDLEYNRDVFLSEKETGDKNRAIAYLLKNNNLLNHNVDEVLDTYFKQCSIEINALDLSKIAYFFANKCVTWDGKKLFNKRIGQTILAIMTTSGMYNYSGRYAIDVGIPSKSGVGGGIVASVPNKYGIGVYSPPLDENGNSIVGINILKDLSREFNLSIF